MKAAWTIALVSLSLIGARAQAATDPQVGHWTLDLSRSRYVSSTAPRSSEATVEPWGKDGVALTVHAVTASGQPMTISYSAQYDGKPYPRTESGPGALAGQVVTLKRTGPRTVERVVYFHGKPGGTERWAISKDGKTRTVTQFGVDLHGKTIDNLQIYVRQ